jgi:hypothetical protein
MVRSAAAFDRVVSLPSFSAGSATMATGAEATTGVMPVVDD